MEKLLYRRNEEANRLAADVRDTFQVVLDEFQEIQNFKATLMRSDYTNSIWVNLFLHDNEDSDIWNEPNGPQEVIEHIIMTFEDWEFPQDVVINFAHNYTEKEFIQVALYIYDREAWHGTL